MLKQLPIFSKLLILVFVMSFLSTSCNFNSNIDNTTEVIEISESGVEIFKSNCAGCHPGGQNHHNKDKPIIGSLKIKSTDTLKEFFSEPHPPMPKFVKIADDSEKLDALYKYLITLMDE